VYFRERERECVCAHVVVCEREGDRVVGHAYTRINTIKHTCTHTHTWEGRERERETERERESERESEFACGPAHSQPTEKLDMMHSQM